MKFDIKIAGMTCSHCVNRVTQALNALPEVEQVAVNLEDKNALLEASAEIPRARIDAAIADAGFEVTDVSAA